MLVYLALGSNIGDRAQHFRDALAAFPPDITALTISPIYESRAQYVTDQPLFYNAVLAATTNLSPEELLAHLKRIEEKVGRTPTFQNDPRVIDLDILLYDDVVMQTPLLTIPHPRIQERMFVLAPLSDIAPDVMHPLLHRTVCELYAATSGEVRKTDIRL